MLMGYGGQIGYWQHWNWQHFHNGNIFQAACGAKTRRQVRHEDTELCLSFASHGITYRHVHEKGVAK